MDLTHEEIERYLNIIFTGQESLYINDELFIFKHPDNFIKTKADLLYEKSFKYAVDDGMLPIKDLEALIKARNIFSEEDETNLDRLRTQLEAQEIILGKTTRVKARQDRLKEIIKDLKIKIKELEYKKTSKLSMSAESKAEEERALFLCWACTYVERDGVVERYWKTFNDLLNERYGGIKDDLFVMYLRFRNGIDTRIVRQLARSSLWRIRYVTSQKVSDPLFGVPTSQYTNDMLNLAYWSNFYQNVYEMMARDRPPDTVIDDDDALDAYMKDYYEERNREDASEWSKNKNKTGRGKLSAFDKEEVIVTQSNELYEDIDYDKPREAQKVKDRVDLTKRTRRS
jgi:hypothetical protein